MVTQYDLEHCTPDQINAIAYGTNVYNFGKATNNPLIMELGHNIAENARNEAEYKSNAYGYAVATNSGQAITGGREIVYKNTADLANLRQYVPGIDGCGPDEANTRALVSVQLMQAITTNDWSKASGAGMQGYVDFAKNVGEVLGAADSECYLSVIVDQFIQKEGNVTCSDLERVGVPKWMSAEICDDAILLYSANVKMGQPLLALVMANSTEVFFSQLMAVMAGGLREAKAAAEQQENAGGTKPAGGQQGNNTNAAKEQTEVKGGNGRNSGTDVNAVSTRDTEQGYSPNGYNPKPGERTLNGYVSNNADPEVSLYTKSPGFNNSNGNAGGQFKRFGAQSHGGVSPHVHQPQRNVSPNGNVYGTVGRQTINGGVTLPSSKDVKQLYEYLNNGKYHK